MIHYFITIGYVFLHQVPNPERLVQSQPNWPNFYGFVLYGRRRYQQSASWGTLLCCPLLFPKGLWQIASHNVCRPRILCFWSGCWQNLVIMLLSPGNNPQNCQTLLFATGNLLSTGWERTWQIIQVQKTGRNFGGYFFLESVGPKKGQKRAGQTCQKSWMNQSDTCTKSGR